MNTAEIVEEIKDFKQATFSILPSIEYVKFLDLLQMVHDYKLKGLHPNIGIRIFFSMPVITTSYEKSFSINFKLIKTYKMITYMVQKRLPNMSNVHILSTKTEIANKFNDDEVINEFTDTKQGKFIYNS